MSRMVKSVAPAVPASDICAVRTLPCQLPGLGTCHLRRWTSTVVAHVPLHLGRPQPHEDLKFPKLLRIIPQPFYAHGMDCMVTKPVPPSVPVSDTYIRCADLAPLALGTRHSLLQHVHDWPHTSHLFCEVYRYTKTGTLTHSLFIRIE